MNHTSSERVTLSTEQQIVFDWLNDELELPVYAEIYKGALDLLYNKSSGYITFLSHAGRDLMNGISQKGAKREQVQYVNRLNKLQNQWNDEWGAKEIHTTDNAESGHLIPYEICQEIQDLIDEHREGRLRASEAESRFFTAFLDYPDQERIPENFLQEWKAAKDWFFAHTHLREKEFEIEASSAVEKHFQTLDDSLYVAASSALERMQSINEILEETNE